MYTVLVISCMSSANITFTSFKTLTGNKSEQHQPLNCYLLCSFLISRGNVSALLQLSALLEKYLRHCVDFLDQASFEHSTLSREVSVESSVIPPPWSQKVPMSMFIRTWKKQLGRKKTCHDLKHHAPFPCCSKGIQGSSRGPFDGLLICFSTVKNSSALVTTCCVPELDAWVATSLNHIWQTRDIQIQTALHFVGISIQQIHPLANNLKL